MCRHSQLREFLGAQLSRGISPEAKEERLGARIDSREAQSPSSLLAGGF